MRCNSESLVVCFVHLNAAVLIFTMDDNNILTMEQCSKIIEEDLHTKVFEIINFDEKYLSDDEIFGLMSSNFILLITVKVNDITKQQEYFVKRLISKYDIQNQMIKSMGAYDKEKFTYDFLKQVSKIEPKYSIEFIPKCFLSIKEKLFVLEDLRQDGFIANKSRTFMMDFQQLKCATELLAKFHSSSIIYEHKKSLETGAKYKMLDEYAQYFKDPLFRKEEKDYLGNKLQVQLIATTIFLIDKFIIYTPEEKEKLKRKVLERADCFFNFFKASDKFFNVINHGDMWSNNILFKYDNEEIVDSKLIDFQGIRYTPPANDFLYLVYSIGNTEYINKAQKDLQVHYYNSLQQCLKNCDIDVNNYLTYEEFEESLEYFRPLAILQQAGFSALYCMQVDPSIANTENFESFIFENRAQYCDTIYDTSEKFREVVHDAFKNLTLL